jgi:hypothetical protein
MVLKSGSSGQPHQFDVAARLPLKLPVRGQLMQVSRDLELEHRARRVARSAGRCRLDTLKAEMGEIEFIHKGIDNADRVISIDIILKTGRQ